jgi:hypothetical protein
VIKKIELFFMLFDLFGTTLPTTICCTGDGICIDPGDGRFAGTTAGGAST